MFVRALAIWFLLLAVAIANGGLREALIVPRAGAAAGHAISTLLLSAFILLVAWLFVPWMAPPRASDALLIGVFWVALTTAFEFLAGHYLFGKPWPVLLADYNVLQGRIWILVLVTTLVAPLVVFRLSAPR
jgi:hypothetical protein